MSSTRAWAVAATVATVEVLKDQGFCRWNYTLRSLHQQAKSNLRSLASPANSFSFSSSPLLVSRADNKLRKEKLKKSEESLRKVIAWIAAASVGAVEVLKDQGFARWNYTLRSLHQHAKNSLRSFSSQATKLTAASVKSESDKMRDIKMKQSEESLRKVMYLSCWGPN
ncbi:Protein of unknown function wound-induced [Dillenia turbinata]|uniref:Wound-responsive family protein n=1 Tax=Dillenia turbinata TaxID=194707 RepID=A0AAN8ZRB8_9MAGN